MGNGEWGVKQMGEIFGGGKRQNNVQRSTFIVHSSLRNGAAPAMTNEQSTMNSEQ
jgi:hypothetical protein